MSATRKTRGALYAERVREAYELNESQEVLVDTIARLLDRIDSLPASDVQEARAQEVVLLRALSALALPDVGETKRPTVNALRASKAGRANAARFQVND